MMSSRKYDRTFIIKPSFLFSALLPFFNALQCTESLCFLDIRLGPPAHGGLRSFVDRWPTFISLSSPSDFLSPVVFSALVQIVPSAPYIPPVAFETWSSLLYHHCKCRPLYLNLFLFNFLMHTLTFGMVSLANRTLSVVQCPGQRFCFVLFHHQDWKHFTVLRYKKFCVYVSAAEVCYEVMSELVTFQRNLWFFHVIG